MFRKAGQRGQAGLGSDYLMTVMQQAAREEIAVTADVVDDKYPAVVAGECDRAPS